LLRFNFRARMLAPPDEGDIAVEAQATLQSRLEPLAEALFGYAVALTRDRDCARDLFQESVLRALAASSVPTCDTAFRSWLFSIMRNRSIDACRSDRRRRRGVDAISMDPPDWIRCEPEPDLAAVIVNQVAVRKAFAELGPLHRDVLALVDVAGFRYAEAASILGVPTGTVMSRVSRAREELCRRLSETAALPLDDPGTLRYGRRR
jgi:RNA polymerase sigma-70 factor, ECF subfamily